MTDGDSLTGVIETLRDVLQLEPQRPLEPGSRLLGGIPEFDSLAVASVLLAIEDRFGLEFDDEDISAELFETIGSLADFVDRARAGTGESYAGGPVAEFIDAGSGRLFALHRGASDASRCVLFVPPFAEEMNRVRPLVTAASVALNEAGRVTCLFDLHGTGDSDGEFHEARWPLWLGNVHDMVERLKERGFATVDLAGIRLGGRLALDYAARRQDGLGRVLLWDPELDGRRFLERFLRARSMAAMMNGRKETVASLRQRLLEGETLEVAGYRVSPALATDLDALDEARVPDGIPVDWIARGDTAGPAADIGARFVQADYPAWWDSVETVAAPALIDATVKCLAA